MRKLTVIAKHDVLFLVQFNNFDQTVDFYWSHMLFLDPLATRSYTLLYRTGNDRELGGAWEQG